MAKTPVSTAGKPPAKGKKIAGVPRKTAVIAGVALLAGVAFIVWRNHQAASTGQDTGTGADTSALGDTSGIQGAGMQGATGTETLVIKIREMHGHKKHPGPRRFPHEPPPPRVKRRGGGRGKNLPPTVGRGRGGRTGAK